MDSSQQIRPKPATAEVAYLEAHLVGDAANDEPARGIASAAKLRELVLRMLDAPNDLPLFGHAFAGLLRCLRSLESRVPGVAVLANRLQSEASSLDASAAAGATAFPFERRVGAHMLYLAAVEIGRNGGQPERLLQEMGARFAIRLFETPKPSKTTLARALNEARKAARSASMGTESRWLRVTSKAVNQLSEAIQANFRAAAEVGFCPPNLRVQASADPIEQFNIAFRRRINDLKVWAPAGAVAGASGHGAITNAALQAHGSALLDDVCAGDLMAALVCLEIITHLPSATLLCLPVGTKAQPVPEAALAWLDLDRGSFCYRLFRIGERGARPELGTEPLYRQTTQEVSLLLTPPLADRLRALARSVQKPMLILRDLVGEVGHAPRAAIGSLGQGGYRVTARRLQDSLPSSLLKMGHSRWPVCLATLSPYLVSSGRSAYGAVRQAVVAGVNADRCRLLGWPAPSEQGSDALIGTFTVPTDVAIKRAFDFLAAKADGTPLGETRADVIRCINSHASWLAIAWAYAFALRRWLIYQISGDQIRHAEAASVLDKDVHEVTDPPVPVIDFARSALLGWDQLVLDAVKQLHRIGSDADLMLAQRLQVAIEAGRRGSPLFSIDGLECVTTVGYRTWSGGLPKSLRLVPNFARQFWPLKFSEQSLPQLLQDLLMRHQVPGLHPGSTNRSDRFAVQVVELRCAMDGVTAALSLRVPSRLRGS